MASENARLSDLIRRISRPEASSNEPPHELLRLRGELARLRQDNEEAYKVRQEKNEEIKKLRQQSPGLPARSLREKYGMSGIDTSSVTDLELGATTNDVLAELRRVGAKFLTDQEKYVGQEKYLQAEISPAAVANTNGDLVTIRMEFYFEDGKLPREGIGQSGRAPGTSNEEAEQNRWSEPPPRFSVHRCEGIRESLVRSTSHSVAVAHLSRLALNRHA